MVSSRLFHPLPGKLARRSSHGIQRLFWPLFQIAAGLKEGSYTQTEFTDYPKGKPHDYRERMHPILSKHLVKDMQARTESHPVS